MSARTRDLPRRSCHVVPGSNERFIAKASSLNADMILFDLEDSVASSEKSSARARVVDAVRNGDWGNKIVCVRLNAWDSSWTYGDVIEVVGRAGERLDEIMLAKVSEPAHVAALDLLVSQVEANSGLPSGQVGIEVQIETARGLIAVEEICAASPRLEAVVVGPVDLSASMGMPGRAAGAGLGDQRGDLFHYAFMKILIAARAYGLQVIDGPYVNVADLEGLRRDCMRTEVLGFDGKWSIHPDQVEILNRAYAPTQDQFDRASRLVEIYREASEGDDPSGAVLVGHEMIDEASRKVAAMVVAKGVRAGMSASHTTRGAR